MPMRSASKWPPSLQINQSLPPSLYVGFLVASYFTSFILVRHFGRFDDIVLLTVIYFTIKDQNVESRSS